MLPVLRPDLPSLDDIAPYLERIDESGVASNDGPLVRCLEGRVNGVAVANATIGLELACRHVFRQGAVRVPVFTFPATVLAVLRAGLKPVLCDVMPDTWAAEPDGRTLMVCPFGYPVEPGPLTDAAGAWGNQEIGNRVISLHATKPLPAGEGGIVCGDEALLDYVRHARNFGFVDGVVQMVGTNAKLSEYHAAVAMASLDRRLEVAEKRREVAARYAAHLDAVVETRPYLGGTVFPVLVHDPDALGRRLANAGYETRRWYYPTLDRHPVCTGLDRESLSVAHDLSERLLCLPFHTFMTMRDVDRVAEIVCRSH